MDIALGLSKDSKNIGRVAMPTIYKVVYPSLRSLKTDQIYHEILAWENMI